MTITPELVISILALAGSGYAVWQTRKHHWMSLLPHLELPVVRNRSPQGVTASLFLRNTGLGPAIIVDRKYTVSGQRFVGERADPIEEIAAQYLAGKYRYQVQRHGLPGVGSIVPAGTEFCIYQVHFPELKEADERAITKLLEVVEFEGTYRSMNGDTFTFSTKSD